MKQIGANKLPLVRASLGAQHVRPLYYGLPYVPSFLMKEGGQSLTHPKLVTPTRYK